MKRVLWKEIEAAQVKIREAIRQTPVVYSDTFSKRTGKEVFLKLENLQKAGNPLYTPSTMNR